MSESEPFGMCKTIEVSVPARSVEDYDDCFGAAISLVASRTLGFDPESAEARWDCPLKRDAVIVTGWVDGVYISL